MKNPECLHEFTGSIIKEETIKQLDNIGVDKTGVYEAEDSYPGYYGSQYAGARTHFLYLTTKRKYAHEEVKRIELKIKKYFSDEFDLASAQLDLFNSLHPCIRVKYLESYEKLKDLQMFMNDERIKFAKREKNLHRKVLINTDKVFLVKEVEDGIYMDQEELEIAYIRIPKHLKVKEFESITREIKNNWSQNGFDAAIAHFNRHRSIEDLVRVYSKELDLKFIQDIQKAYLKLIK